MKTIVIVVALIAAVIAEPIPRLSREKLDLQVDASRNDSKIVGGQPATDGQIPYIYSLRAPTSHRCGGIILATNKLITACHCTAGVAATSLTIRYNSLQHGSGGQTVTMARKLEHPSYNSGTIDYDYALLYPATALTLGQTNARALPLAPQGDDPAAGEVLIVSGWGTTSEGGSIPAALRTVEIPVVSRADCNTQYGAGSITARMICAGVPQGGLDACQGDSGGPYVSKSRNVLVGLTSWGYGCARPTHAGVAARIGEPAVWTWINNNN